MNLFKHPSPAQFAAEQKKRFENAIKGDILSLRLILKIDSNLEKSFKVIAEIKKYLTIKNLVK